MTKATGLHHRSIGYDDGSGATHVHTEEPHPVLRDGMPPADGKPTTEYEQLMRYAADLARLYREERAGRAALFVAGQTTRRILDSIGDAVLVVDRAGRIIDVNAAFCRIIAVQRDQVLGRRVREVPELERVVEWLEMDLPPDSKDLVLDIPLPQLPPRHLEAHVSTYEGKTGDLLGTVWVLRDVTAQKRAEATRQEFLAIVSHQLRTPLTAVLGFAELLEISAGAGTDEQERTFIAGILDNARQLRDIVEQILTFTSIGADTGTFIPEPVSLSESIERAVAMSRNAATQRGIRISVELPPKPIVITAVASMITRAVEQILDNAVTFNTRDGSVWVSLREEENDAVVAVRDTGRGIPPSDLDRIFDPFYRCEDFMKANTRGLGLSLPLAQRIIRWHGGTISVSSALGVGSTFTIRLPKRPSGKQFRSGSR